jgi:uncharacterized membrane protein
VTDPETRRRIEALEARVRELEARLAAPPPPQPRPVPHPPAAGPGSTGWGAPPAQPPPPSAPPPAPLRPFGRPVAPAQGWQLVEGQPTVAAARPRDMERLLGGNWLARIGVLVLALGVVFFLKLAYDNDWVPRWGRIAIGVLGGAGVFATGEWLRRRGFDTSFAQILAGGGAIIAYATLYAAYALPEYRAELGITLPLELTLLALASAGLGAYALWRDLPVLGGVATALSALLVAPAGDLSTAGVLFVTLMGVAMLLAAAWRGWDAVVLVSVLSLDIALLAAAALDEVPWQVVAVCAVVANAMACIASERSRGDPQFARAASGFAASALVVLLAVSASGHVGDATAWSLLGVGLACLAGLFVAPRTRPALALAGALMMLAWPTAHFAWERWQVLAYAGLAAAAWGATFAWPRAAAWSRMGATAAAGIGALALFFLALFEDLAGREPLVGGGFALLLAALCAGIWSTTGRPPAPDGAFAIGLVLLGFWPMAQFPDEAWQTVVMAAGGWACALAAAAWPAGRALLRPAAAGLAVLATLDLWVLGQAGILQQVTWVAVLAAVLAALLGAAAWHAGRGQAQPAARWAGLAAAALAPVVALGFLLDGWGIPVSWAVAALLWVGAGVLLRDSEVRIAALALFGLVVARIFLVDLQGLDLPSRVVVFILTGILLLLGSYLYARQRRAEAPPHPPQP